MITIPAGVRIYLACGVTDMRRGFDGLSIMAQDVLKQDPFSGAIFCFRGRRGDLVKILYWDGQAAGEGPVHLAGAEIYARAGLDIDRGQLAEWLGHAVWLLRPLVELIAAHVMTGRVIHADDTPVPVLAPGAGKTKTGRQWVYLRDERPHAGTAPPAVLYRYTPDRKGEHCRAELANFTGWLHADGYAGFGKLYEIAGARSAGAMLPQGPPRVAEVACWSHVRRGFFDEYASHKSAIAKEALDRIGALFDIERVIAGKPPELRRSVRQRTARPKIGELARWLDAQLRLIPVKSDLAGAIRYARSRWDALTRYLDDGRLEISNNAAENQIRPVAMLESLCIPSSSVCKHWNRFVVSDATRATFSGHRRFGRFRRQVVGANLVWRAGHNLNRGQHTGFDQAA